MPIDYDRARETIWGAPGFQVRRSTVVSSGLTFLPNATYVIETIRTDDGWRVFIQWVDADGGQREVLPDKAVRALWRHYESIMATARKERAKRGSETRKLKAAQRGEDNGLQFQTEP